MFPFQMNQQRDSQGGMEGGMEKLNVENLKEGDLACHLLSAESRECTFFRFTRDYIITG